jgi:prepilin-type processing-associated H-X9-DG protein
MKVNFTSRNSRAMTFIEVLLVVACVLVLAATLLSVLATVPHRRSRVGCASNLKQINLEFRIWEGDNGNLYPMAVSTSSGGGKESIETGNPGACFQCISNEMNTTKILVCPDDPMRTYATNWDDFNNSHMSYFLSADAREDHPEMILDSDDNFEVNSSPIKSGLFGLSSNTSVAWAPGRHSDISRPHFWSLPKRINYGNIGFADGSVNQFGPLQLHDLLLQMDPVTNRIAIP